MKLWEVRIHTPDAVLGALRRIGKWWVAIWQYIKLSFNPTPPGYILTS